MSLIINLSANLGHSLLCPVFCCCVKYRDCRRWGWVGGGCTVRRTVEQGQKLEAIRGGAEAAPAAVLGRPVGSTCFASRRARCQHQHQLFPRASSEGGSKLCQPFYPYIVPTAISQRGTTGPNQRGVHPKRSSPKTITFTENDWDKRVGMAAPGDDGLWV